MSSVEPDGRMAARPTSVPCRHLRSGGMYIYTDGLGGRTEEGYDHSSCWCLKTMKGFGPDDDLVGSQDCRDEARSCYEPT